MSNEYIFEINDALYDHEIGKVCMMPKVVGMLIRCKDCIYFDKYNDCIEKYQWDGFCADWARTTYENWYCSRAERRTDEN